MKNEYEITQDELLPDIEDVEDYELGEVQDEESTSNVDLYNKVLKGLKIRYCGKEMIV